MDLSRRLAAGELSELFGAVAVQSGPAHAALRLSRGRAPRHRGGTGRRARGRRGLYARRERRARFASRAALGIPAAARRAARLDRRKIRCWSCTRCGGSCNTAACRDELDRRRLERAAAARSDAAGAHALDRVRLRRATRDWDTPNYSAEAPCVQAALHRLRPRAHAAVPRAAAVRGRRGRAGRRSRRRPAATTGRWPASTRAPASRSSPTTCISISAFRRSGIRRDCASPAIRPSTSRASRCPARPRWPPAPTARWPGDSPTATAISPTCAGASARARTTRVRREHIAVKGADDVEVTYRDVGAGVVLDGDEYADDVASGDCLQVAWLATRPEATNFALLGLENARSIDDVLALAPRVGIPGQNLVVGDSRGRIAWTLLGRVPRTARPRPPVRRARVSRRARIIRASPIRPSGVCGPRISAWSRASSRRVLGDDEVDVGAGGYDIGARARQIRDDLLRLAASGHRGATCSRSSSIRARCSWRAGATCCWRSSTRTPCTMRRCAASFARWSATGSARPAPTRWVTAWCARSAATRWMRCGAARAPGC